MGRTEKVRKKTSFVGIIFKIIFSVVFLALAILVTLFALAYLGYSNNATDTAWNWALSIPLVQNLWDYINTFEGRLANTGMTLVLVGLDVFLVYFGIMFIIKKIPIIGRIIKWLTGIIPSLSILAIIIGVCLLYIG